MPVTLAFARRFPSLWLTFTVFNLKKAFLTADGVTRPVLHLHAKLHKNRLNGGKDMAI